MTPSGISTGQDDFTLYWLLTGVSDGIDLNRMSTGDRRDFPIGVSGSHTSVLSQTCFREVPFDAQNPPPYSYLLTMSGNLRYADYTTVSDPVFSGEYYDQDHGCSQNVFIANSGEFADLGVDSILRYSYPALQSGYHEQVVALLPSAREKLQLISIEPLGANSPAIPVFPFGQIMPVDSTHFYTNRNP